MSRTTRIRLATDVSFQHATFNWATPGSWIGHRYYSAEFYEDIARIAARGVMDMVFFGDAAETPESYGGDHRAAVAAGVQWPKHDPMPFIPLMARAAPGVGFGLTMSTTYHHPFHVARLFNALDHVTDGRVAWNAVTSAYKNEAANFGYDPIMPHEERYARAREHMEVVRLLWESVESDAVVLDRAQKIFAHADKVRRIDYQGAYYSLPGPLPCMASPQGCPPIIQAGQSEPGMDLASSFADMQFVSRRDVLGMRAHRADLDSRLLAKGRDPRDVGIFWALRVTAGETAAEAQAKDRAWRDLLPPNIGIIMLSSFFGVDFSKIPGHLKLSDAADVARSQITHTGFFEDMIRTSDPNLTLEEYGRIHMTSGLSVSGSPAQVADELERLHHETGANGGFILANRARPTPGYLQDFVSYVVPELQRRGLTERAYSGETLRDRLTN